MLAPQDQGGESQPAPRFVVPTSAHPHLCGDSSWVRGRSLGLPPNPAQHLSGFDAHVFQVTEVTQDPPFQLYHRLGRSEKDLLY